MRFIAWIIFASEENAVARVLFLLPWLLALPFLIARAVWKLWVMPEPEWLEIVPR